jgi:hypothetical protein
MQTLLNPSSLLPNGLKIQKFNQTLLFKFSDELGDRLQVLLDKKKEDCLSPEEMLELESTGELDEIFSYINTVMLAEQNASH